jgi:hypothetical protein
MAELSDDTTDIRERVRERYAAAARAVADHRSSGEERPGGRTPACSAV